MTRQIGTEPPWQRLNPRRHFAAALGSLVFALVVAGALAVAQWVAHQERQRVLEAAPVRLQEAAAQSADALRLQLQVRMAAVQSIGLSGSLATTGVTQQALALNLAVLQQQFPELRWLGALDTNGHLQAIVGGEQDAPVLPGVLRAPQVPLLPSVVHVDATSTLVLIVPLADATGHPAGTLIAGMPNQWLQAQLAQQQRRLARYRPRHVLLLDARRQVLAGPSPWQGGMIDSDPQEAGRYLLGSASLSLSGESDTALPGWQLMVREEVQQALGSAQQTYRAVLFSVLGVGLLVAIAAMLMVHRLLRRLAWLARQAQAIQDGRSQRIVVPDGQDEIHAIGRALAQVVAHLQGEKAALAQLNQELDTRVAERTARIEQLVQEAHATDLVRQRLRMARLVHDTLAQSLMGLQTQIRLVRKFATQWDAARLDAELALAAQAVSDGLAEVRAAIGHMRREGHGESALDARLRELLQRFADRSGVRVDADIHPAAGSLGGARTATVLAIACEALRNVERHARATKVHLSLQPEAADDAAAAHWVLRVDDDGVGFDPQATFDGHFGLTGLREQAELLGATLVVDSAPGCGCRLGLRFAA